MTTEQLPEWRPAGIERFGADLVMPDGRRLDQWSLNEVRWLATNLMELLILAETNKRQGN